MTRVKIEIELDIDFNEKATDDYKQRTVQGVVDNIYSRQLSHQLMLASSDEYKHFAHSIQLDVDIAKQISKKAKVKIIKDETKGI